jgi:hypothetical protein
VIFRADGKGENSSQPPEPTTGEATTQDLSGLRVSGPFRLDGREELRFVSVPAAFMDGFSDLLFTANIDASTTFLGIRVASRAGTWRLAVPRLGADTRQLGTQYFGTRARPAVRLRYPHEDGQGHERVVLSFGSEAERAAFLRCL